MKYYRIKNETEPKITGTNNAIYSVELKKNHSFASREVKEIWDGYFKPPGRRIEAAIPENFKVFDSSKVSNKVKYFPVGKKVKQLDIMKECPALMGTQLLLTQKVRDILLKFRLSPFNCIPVLIDTFDEQYYLFGVPLYGNEIYDFSKCVFIDKRTGQNITFNNDEEFNSVNRYPFIKEIFLTEYIDSDVIFIFSDLFISERVLDEFKKQNVTGYVVTDVVLEN